ncbi:Na(+)/citrate cotransporter-like [Babylonia areolata]|uniref:Na(+)/citrate cotransporter-like n=1 Tax=Babylonia areolata TaxID=304850 RepID=UPI003FD3ED1A
MSESWEVVKRWRTLLVILLTPLLLLPLPLIINTPEGRTAYVLFLMAVYWVTEAVPIAVTSLMPVFLFPMMDIASAKVVASSYIKDLLMLFLGGLMMAVAIETWNLHRRIALRILLLVGSEPRWLMLGLMLATWLLSMWMSNTATTAMMVPITDAILQQLEETLLDDPSAAGDNKEEENKNDLQQRPEGGDDKVEAKAVDAVAVAPLGDPESRMQAKKQFDLMCKGLLLSICYGANSGGIATLTGTGPNLILKNNADDVYGKHNITSPVNFASWMGFGLPLSALVVLVCWVWLQIMFLRCRGWTDCCRRTEEKEAQGKRVRGIILQEYSKLGPVSFAERAVLVLFSLLVVLWITRDLGGVGGWGDLFAEETVSDSTPAVLIGFILFFFPSENPFRRGRRTAENYNVSGQAVEIEHEERTLKPLLSWADAHAKVPWSLFLLLGGGFALSDGCRISGLSEWIGQQLEVFSDIDKVAMLLVLCYITAAMTEITSNTAISILLLPILSTLALRTGVHPLYYMIPTSLSCSFAFMLPVATPPNAIVFATGRIKVVDMMLAGVVMNAIAVPVLVMATVTWGEEMFRFTDVPPAFLNASLSASAASSSL